MAKFGVYRVEQPSTEDPYTELQAYEVLIADGIYKFRNHVSRLIAAYPIRHFYIVRLDD
jgi:hypothetical protein